VNRFADRSPSATDVFQLDPQIEPRQVERVRALRAARSQTEWRAALDAVDSAARGMTNLVLPIIAAVEARATLGEIADVMRKVFGEHQDVSPVAPAAARP
jgi:methylmalonyl-CoA mutase N-terminal domain/subunit